MCKYYAHDSCIGNAFNNCKHCATYIQGATVSTSSRRHTLTPTLLPTAPGQSPLDRREPPERCTLPGMYLTPSLPHTLTPSQVCTKSCCTSDCLSGFRCGWCGISVSAHPHTHAHTRTHTHTHTHTHTLTHTHTHTHTHAHTHTHTPSHPHTHTHAHTHTHTPSHTHTHTRTHTHTHTHTHPHTLTHTHTQPLLRSRMRLSVLLNVLKPHTLLGITLLSLASLHVSMAGSLGVQSFLYHRLCIINYAGAFLLPGYHQLHAAAVHLPRPVEHDHSSSRHHHALLHPL